jgi:hypothetical protein
MSSADATMSTANQTPFGMLFLRFGIAGIMEGCLENSR